MTKAIEHQKTDELLAAAYASIAAIHFHSCTAINNPTSPWQLEIKLESIRDECVHILPQLMGVKDGK